MVTLAQVKKIARGPIDTKNAQSVLLALEKYGEKFGLNKPHRVAQFLAQVMHESGEFKWDKELWGPTPAQQRYDTRTDLGNTPERDGDGKLYSGRTAIQITGRSNVKQFRDWCRKFIDPKAPDFLKTPELMNTDPWEGLGPLWYWDTRKLNRLADQGDVENITERINGGLNGYADRVTLLGRASLVLLGYASDAISAFQKKQGLLVDGKPGPKTRAALHVALVNLTEGEMAKATVTAAPVTEVVVEEKPVAVTPEQLDKPVTQTTGFKERIAYIFGLLGIGGGAWLQDWRVIAAIVVAMLVLVGFGLVFHNRIVNAVKAIKEAVQS